MLRLITTVALMLLPVSSVSGLGTESLAMNRIPVQIMQLGLM